MALQACDYEAKAKKYEIDNEDDKKVECWRRVRRHKDTARRKNTNGGEEGGGRKALERFTLYATRSLRSSEELYAFLVRWFPTFAFISSACVCAARHRRKCIAPTVRA